MFQSLRKAWRRHFMAYEAGAALIVFLAYALWQQTADGSAFVDTLLKGNRAVLYGTLASIFGSLLGFVIATIAIVLTLTQSDRFAVLRAKRQYSNLWRIFTSTVRWLGAATIVSVGGLLFDRETAPSTLTRDIAVAVVLVAIARLGRVIWGLEQLIQIAITPPGGTTSAS